MTLRGGYLHHGFRWGAATLAVVVVLTSLSTDADARSRRHRKAGKAVAAQSYDPPAASIVVDANTGKVLQATNADAPRHPASLTKIMTLYMLFERLEQGKLKLSSELPVSAHAASQAPSKLGLKPGETIRVESAIRAVVTKSANDVAVIIAEAIGGDEPSFARMMTAKARQLGMRNTNYFNASGLPDDRQITTARDQSILGRAAHDRFPQYYAYFSTRSFEFRGHAMRNHNHLLGAVPGLDGLKTGYIRASGFNIVTSVRRSGKHIVTAVFGGRTAKVRDAKAKALIEGNFALAAANRTSPMVVEGWDSKDGPAIAVAAAAPAPAPVAMSAPAPVREPVAVASAAPVAPLAVKADEGPSPGSTDPIRPNAVKTVSVQPGAVTAAALSPLPPENRRLAPTTGSANVTTVATIKGEAAPLPPPGARPGVLGVLPASKVASISPAVPVPAAATSETSAKARNGGWMIQVGAFDDEKGAKERLNSCQGKAAKELAKAEPFTEKVAKGEKSLYRARFAGLEKDQAEAACKNLKRSDIPCMLLKH